MEMEAQGARTRVIGLTGGVGAGKSRVLGLLASEHRAQVIQADLLARELEQPGRLGHKALVEALGDGILRGDKTIDTARLARLIFRDKKALETVNAIIHPLVWEEIRRRASGSSAPLVVVEAALFSKNEGDFFDEIWYVYTSEEVRIGRLMAGRGYSREKCLEIMGNQPTEEEFRRVADAVIDNDGDERELEGQLRRLLEPGQNRDGSTCG